MISCTEFIPAYSELFTYLDDHYGRAEVERFWAYLFAPTGKGIPLINYAKKKGLRGCWEYWEGTLTEEAADCVKYINETQGWIYSEMRYCPSKGRLLELEKEIGLKPYYDYCGHCDYYRAAIEQVGLGWVRFHMHVDEAKCCSMIYDPQKFSGMIQMSKDVEVLDIKPDEHEYFHRDFHSSLNMGIHFIAQEHGLEALKDYLTLYTKHVYIRTIEAMQSDPLGALEARIAETYHLEKAEDALSLNRNGDHLSVRIAYCPAVKHLRETGREVTPWFRYSTQVVMQTLADCAGLTFTMDSYDEGTGTASYSFSK
jgi:hypothetical protein